MDPITHTLIGAGLAQTGLRRVSPQATATLLLGANAPDIDAVTMLMGRDLSLGARRGWTHGVLAMVLLPVVLAGLLWLLSRLRSGSRPGHETVRFGPILALATLAVLSHPLLDWLNTYGIRLLMPFDSRWFYGDALFIVDPWVWLIAAAPVVLATTDRVASRVAWLIGAAAASWLVLGTSLAPPSAKIVWGLGLAALAGLRLHGVTRRQLTMVAGACLIGVVVYVAAMVAGSSLAGIQARQWLDQQGIETEIAMAGPIVANPFARDVVASTGKRYHFLIVNWLSDTPIREAGPSIAIGERGPIVRAALESPRIQGTRQWLRLPTYEVQARADGYRVTIRDLRFARRDRSGIGLGVVQVDLTRDLELLEPAASP